MNARDVSGQTVLGIAILAHCSLKLIKALIDHGAKIDPDILNKDPLTPLQAACVTGSSEVTRLLLGRGADVNRVFPGNQTPAELAQEFGNAEILQLIDEKSQSMFLSDGSPSNQHDSLDDENITVDGDFDFSFTNDRTIKTFDDEDQPNRLLGFSYPLPPM
jgi:ankyrin repeat protein